MSGYPIAPRTTAIDAAESPTTFKLGIVGWTTEIEDNVKWKAGDRRPVSGQKPEKNPTGCLDSPSECSAADTLASVPKRRNTLERLYLGGQNNSRRSMHSTMRANRHRNSPTRLKSVRNHVDIPALESDSA